MQTYIAILRGINVGGNRKILMSDLKSLLTEMGLADIQTYIQSGNVLFTHQELNKSELATNITEQIKVKFGFEVPVIIRTADELQTLFAKNPFSANAEIAQLHLTFLSESPAEEKLQQLQALSYPPDEFTIVEKNVYLKCVNKYHETKLNNNFFEKKLGVSATTRNWKTVKKLVEMTGFEF